MISDAYLLQSARNVLGTTGVALPYQLRRSYPAHRATPPNLRSAARSVTYAHPSIYAPRHGLPSPDEVRKSADRLAARGELRAIKVRGLPRGLPAVTMLFWCQLSLDGLRSNPLARAMRDTWRGAQQCDRYVYCRPEDEPVVQQLIAAHRHAGGAEYDSPLLVALEFAEFFTALVPGPWNTVFTDLAERVHALNVPLAEYDTIKGIYDMYGPVDRDHSGWWRSPQCLDLLDAPEGGTVTLLDGQQARRAERLIRQTQRLSAPRKTAMLQNELGAIFPWIREQPERGHLFLTLARSPE